MCKEGSINGYECRECGGLTVVIHKDPGTTPMFLACRADGRDPQDPEQKCKGVAGSLMYPKGAPPLPPQWEWYKPSPEAIKRLEKEHPAMYDHIMRGGLELRRLY